MIQLRLIYTSEVVTQDESLSTPQGQGQGQGQGLIFTDLSQGGQHTDYRINLIHSLIFMSLGLVEKGFKV